MHHMPNDVISGLAPIQIEGDWNCFHHTVSYLLCKSQAMYTELRVCIIYEAVQNIEKYIDHNYVSIEPHNFSECGTLPEQYSQYSDNYNPYATFNMLQLYKEEVLDICKDGAFVGIWQIFQIANVIKWPICSVHPNIGNPNATEDLHKTVYCIDNTYNAQSPLHIMWTLMQVNAGQRPCHFVPLLRLVHTWYIKYMISTI